MKINFKSTSFLFLLFVIAIVIIVINFFSLIKTPTDDCTKEKELSFNGVVTGLELDSFNKAQKFIIINGSEKIIPPYTYGLWNEVEVGDSIVKESGNLNYVIYRGKSIHSKKKLEWDRPCN